MIRRYAIAILLGLSASAPMAGRTPRDAAALQVAATRPVTAQIAAGQTRTLLPDGRWLTIGGEGAEGRASLWNPATDVTVPISLPTPRAWHTATILADGTVLVAGGRDGTALVTTLELFDPATQTFMPLAVDGATPRAQHTATLLTDGRVLVAGGSGDDTTALPAEIWDLQTRTAVAVSDVSNALAIVRQTATLQSDGRVELSGGQGFDGRATNGAVIIDPNAHTIVASTSERGERVAPILAGSLPANGATNVSLDTHLAVRFSTATRMDLFTQESVTLTGPDGPVTVQAIPAEDGRLVFVWPAAPLEGGMTYTLAVAGIVDLTGVPVAAAAVSFTTVASPQPNGPAIDAEAWVPGRDGTRDGWRTNRPPSPWESLAPLMASPGVTAISGRVLTLDGRPLPDVSLEIEGAGETRSDRTGRFLLPLTSSATARRVLRIDGASASRPMRRYGFFEYGFTVNGGMTNVLPFTIWMPKLDVAHQLTIPSPTTGEVVIKTPYIGGLELHLPAGTTIVGEDGKPVTTIGITPIPVDRPPFPLAKNVSVPVYFTIQPGGGYVRTSGAGPKGGWLVYPNYHQDLAGQRLQFFHYDPDVKDWYVYGMGTVTPDGSQVKPDATTRIYSFTGAMINDGQSPPNSGQTPGGPTSGDPVDPSTGIFVMHKTDLYLPDLIPLALTRVYDSGDNSNQRPFGRGMTHPYAMFMHSENQYQQADLILPEGGKIHYVRTSPGTSWTDAVMTQQETSTIPAPPTPFYKSVLKWNGAGWNLTLKDGTVYVFGENAPLQAVRDRYGNQTTVTWYSPTGIGYGYIARITGPSGRSISFTYDANNRVQRADDSAGRSVLYAYDPATGNLLTVTDPEGNVTTYTWDANNRLATIQDGRNIVYLTNHYDVNGRVDHQTLADPQAQYTYAYTTDANGNITQTTITNPRGYTEQLTFNSSHYVLTDTEAVGQPEQRTTTFERPTQPGTNFPTAIVDSLNRRTELSYDDAGHLIVLKRLAGTVNQVMNTYTYESQYFQLASVTDPSLHEWTIGYDSNGRVTGVTDPLGHQTIVNMNAQGQITALTDPLHHIWLYGYSGPDQTSTTTPLGSVWRSTTDFAGRVLSATDPLGRTTAFTPDRLNRVTSITDPLSGQTQFEYDANGRVLSITDAMSHATTYSYDPSDRMASRSDPLLATASYTYDQNGNLSQITDRNNQVTRYQYDALDRLTLATYADASTTQFVYDGGDRLLQVVDSASGTITRNYDLLDHVVSEGTPDGLVSYTYDADGLRSTMTVNGQPQVTYGYDHSNRLTSVTQAASTVSLTYDDADRRSTITFPNGIVETFGYDDADQLTGVTFALSGTTLGSVIYGYSQSGTRTSVSGSWARVTLPPPLSGATYDNANRTQLWGGQPYSYDPNGNLANDGLTTFAWNARNQLVGLGGDAAATFGYDGLGRRRSKTVGGFTTRFLYDGLNAVQEQSGVGTPAANILTGLGVDDIFARFDAAGTSFLLRDALGSTLELADTSGGLATHYSFEPFGAATETGTSSTNANDFTGRENDRTGLLFSRARYYSSRTSRFISEDPLAFAAGDTNLYAYVGDDPIDDADPLGLIGLVDISNAIAGAGDSLTFGGTAMARRLLNGGCDPADTGSRAYAGGEAAEVVAEIALTAGSAALKQLAAQADREVVRQAARQMTRDIVRGDGQVVHHVNPLFGHPGNFPTLFPTGGLPAAVHSGPGNVAVVDAAEHAGIHRAMRRMERAGAAAVNPGTTAGRMIRNMMGRQCGCS